MDTRNHNTQLGYRIPGRDTLHPKGKNTFIFDSEEYRKYYSSLDVEIYFSGSDKMISELLGIQFVVQQNAMPLFGYNSYVYDEIAVGSRIINGTFSMHFLSPRFLFELIKLPEHIIKSHFNAQTERDNLDIGGGTEQAQYTQSKAPLWNNTFDIVVQYGNPVDMGDGELISPASITLTDVQIVSSTQGHDVAGDPVTDTYNFVAKDILYDDIKFPGEPKDYTVSNKGVFEEKGFELSLRRARVEHNAMVILLSVEKSPEGATVKTVNAELEGTVYRFRPMSNQKEWYCSWTETFPEEMEFTIQYEEDGQRKTLVRTLALDGESGPVDVGVFSLESRFENGAHYLYLRALHMLEMEKTITSAQTQSHGSFVLHHTGWRLLYNTGMTENLTVKISYRAHDNQTRVQDVMLSMPRVQAFGKNFFRLKKRRGQDGKLYLDLTATDNKITVLSARTAEFGHFSGPHGSFSLLYDETMPSDLSVAISYRHAQLILTEDISLYIS